MDINGAGAIISGGASGLGEATARVLASAGVKVTIADLNADKGKALADELGGVFVSTDVTDEGQVQNAVDQAVATGAPLRIGVACAGIGWASRIVGRDGTPHDLGAYKKIVEVNLIGTFNFWRIAGSAISQTEALESGSRGVLVGTASVAAFDGQIGQISYSASKGGIVGMTLPAARDLAPVGVRVCTIAPGLFDTPLLGMLPDEQKAALAKDVVFPKRLGRPEEYGKLVRAIAEIDYLNGETFRLDGALRMPPK
ncbi:MAG TPA: SDR family NAD(P)-dependent oxidoreductase [Mycobacteriales bacterium]|jgi:NAD(P)-dependent dehydrogenase (short-subunit alcohol dehydrogenase family)|nr:SDR family NAD(P)-dependent oxidoreductase [Mycobacteriales bacterium]